MEIPQLRNTENLLMPLIIANDLRPTDMVRLPRYHPLNPFRQHLNPRFKHVVSHRPTLSSEIPPEHRRVPTETPQTLIDLLGTDTHTLFSSTTDQPIIQDQAAQGRSLKRLITCPTPTPERRHAPAT